MADEQSGWRIEFYVTRTGETPMKTFLASLTGKLDEQAVMMLQRVRMNRDAVKGARLIETGLFELKGFQVRLYFMYRPGYRIVFLDGDVKKQDRIAQDVLKRIRAYRRDYEAREQHGT